jgi:hypothetical protein
MGLIVEGTEDKKLYIEGTNVELPSVYVRFEYANRQDGKSVEIAIYTYTSREDYKKSLEPIEEFDEEIRCYIPTDMANYRFLSKIDDEVSTLVVMDILKSLLEEEGYHVD